MCQVVAAAFTSGHVGLWNISTKSTQPNCNTNRIALYLYIENKERAKTRARWRYDATKVATVGQPRLQR